MPRASSFQVRAKSLKITATRRPTRYQPRSPTGAFCHVAARIPRTLPVQSPRGHADRAGAPALRGKHRVGGYDSRATSACPSWFSSPPSATLDDPDFIRMAMGGQDLVRVGESGSLEQAVQGADLVLATTSSRSRDQRRVLTLPEARALLAERMPRRVAVVFGPERGGLSADELRTCHARVTVPTSPALPVLNLAQAGWRSSWPACTRARSSLPPRAPPWTTRRRGRTSRRRLHTFRRRCWHPACSTPQNPARVMDQVRRWLGRTVPTRREAALLHALAAHVEYLCHPPPKTLRFVVVG
ncbi:MAG: TrmH family RNA methyltransferase [Thermoanaerobaculaceae bacterium]